MTTLLLTILSDLPPGRDQSRIINLVTTWVMAAATLISCYQDIQPALLLDHLSTELSDARKGGQVTLLDSE